MTPRRRPKKPRSYRGSRAVDASCRNHGGCPWCESNRLAATNRRIDAATAMMLDGLASGFIDSLSDEDKKEIGR